jgi:polyhydroxyalkanoate synthesis regulator protein
LKAAIKEMKDGQDAGNKDDTTKTILEQIAYEESKKTKSDIYDEVFIDEVNAELISSVEKSKSDVVVVLMRQERLKPFARRWNA